MKAYRFPAALAAAPPVLALLISALLAAPRAQARSQDSADANWAQWRGPDQNGVSAARGLPLEWSADENVAWKTALPSWSGATPIIWGDRIFVMSPSALTEEEKEAQAERESASPGEGRRGRRGGRGGRGAGRSPGGQTLQLLCLSKSDGKILWVRPLGDGNQLYRKGNDASPSPVTDGRHVWAVTGNGVVTAFDMDGEKIWEHDLQEKYGKFGHNWGYASSPLLAGGKLVIEVLHGSHTDEPSYIVALDGTKGAPLWKVDRPTDAPRESPDAYTTPLLFEHAGKTQIVISGGDYVTGHDPGTGEELWRIAGLNPRGASNYRIVASPLAADGMIYAPTRVRPLLAIRAGDDLMPEDEDVAWKWDERGSPDVPTPACDGEHFYMVSDAGMATCLDAETGAVVWGPERTVQGTVSSSPLLADGKLYFTNEEGVTVVLAAGKKFEQLAVNELDGSYTLSSIVPSGSRLFVRTERFLYCIEQEEQ